MSVLLRDVEVEGDLVDVSVELGRVSEIGTGLNPGSASVVDGRGGALLSGLHDHHLHLLALAADLSSVDLRATPPEAMQAALGADGEDWLRAVGYDESVSGPLDRWSLDSIAGDRPVRVQHRSGALWVLNSAALARIDVDDSADVERLEDGTPTGRLWRYDDRLRRAIGTQPPDLVAVGRLLAEHGITGVTDATPGLDAGAVTLLGEAVAAGDLPPVQLMATDLRPDALPAGVSAGPAKIILSDHRLPGLDELAETIARHRPRPVAVHCVTRESLFLLLNAFDLVGSVPGDRVEHAAVVPMEAVRWLARLGLTVVTQPGFLRDRGDTYLDDTDSADRDDLYPWRRLRDGGVRVAASSDAPYGPLDPWAIVHAAEHRRAPSGRTVVAAEAVSAFDALASYLTAADAPGHNRRRVEVGGRADLLLLETGLDEALRSERMPWRGTATSGRWTWAPGQP